MQNVVIINNLVVVQLHHPEDPPAHVQDRPANFKDPVDDQPDLLAFVDGRIDDNLVVKEAGQFIEPIEVVVLAAEIEVVADQVLIAAVFEVKLAQNEPAGRCVVVFGRYLIVPIIKLFNRFKAPDVVPDNLDQLAEAVKDLLVDDCLLSVVAPANVHHPLAVLVEVIVDPVSFLLPLRVEVQIS